MARARDRQLVRRVTTSLRTAYGRHAVSTSYPALEELLLGILHDGVPEQMAVAALEALSRSFVDWNEARVGSPAEIAATLPGIPDAHRKGEIIVRALRKVCARMSEMSLESLREKEPHETAQLIAGIDDFPEDALARATIIGLGHSVLPLTPKVALVCRRLGLLDGSSNRKVLTRRIERAVSKRSMFEFHWLLSRHAEAVCQRRRPGCVECSVRKACRAGRKVKVKKKSVSAR